MKKFRIPILISLLFLISCQGDEPNEEGYISYFCDAETVERDGSRIYFSSGGHEFRTGAAQSDEEAYEGKYSVKLDSNYLYGMTITLDDVEMGEYFEVSVMEKSRSGNVSLIAGVTGEANYNLRTYPDMHKTDPDEWTRHFLSFTIDTPIEELTIYTFSAGDVSYWDNLDIRRYKKRPAVDIETDLALNIYMPPASFDTIQHYKEEIVKDDIIRGEYKQYVPAFIIDGNDSLPIQMRIKGDWTDHIISGKTSYRIKTSSSHAFDDLRSFSIQHPNTRNFMHEWFVHKLMDEENLLSTKYEFLPVKINEVSQGIYALEEHFDKQLLEGRMRREGPILKLDESGFWEKAFLEHELDTLVNYPFYSASIVDCFKSNRTAKSDVLFAEFTNGAKLLDLFQKFYMHPEELFDMKDLARYYAICDLTNVHHALAWHNRRFYYNPVTAKLEHIGFDMLPAILPFNDLLVVSEIKNCRVPAREENLLNRYIFLNDEFRTYYTAYLNTFSSTEFLDSLFHAFDDDLKKNEALMAYEVADYKMDKNFYYKKASLIRDQLDSLDAMWDQFNHEYKGKPVDVYEQKFPPLDRPFILKEISVNAYLKEVDTANYVAQLENFHPNDVTLLGYAIKVNADSMIPFDSPQVLKAYNSNKQVADYIEINLNQKPKKIFFKIQNDQETIYKKKFLKWQKPQGLHPRIELLHQFSERSPYYTIVNNQVVFKSCTIDHLIYIPQEYNVVFNEGTTIDLISGGGIILNSTTRFLGTEELPINFLSSDSTGMGITILKADSVYLDFVNVRNMSTLDYKGWTLTGAFTVYESEVYMRNLNISSNFCEDGLNLIRCHFDVANISIDHSKSDAFDADFCTGEFGHSKFSMIGNDCIDFSGSMILIHDIEVNTCGDKGVSAGERSFLTLKNIHIQNALTGIASKDDSRVEGNLISIKNANVGLAAFQKKPEYDRGFMNLTEVTYENLNYPAWIELGSSVVVNGKEYFGMVKFDIEAMYARFEK